MSDSGLILDRVSAYYSAKIRQYGPTPQGVDWNSQSGQEERFARLCTLFQSQAEGSFSVNDYGCGYGALAHYMRDLGYDFTYVGLDISEAMLDRAQALSAGLPEWQFVRDPGLLLPADYTVASGIFNAHMGTALEEWQSYVRRTIEHIAAVSRRGFAFNALTIHSDAEYMRPDRLYYADPTSYFSWCLATFSRHVALLHDYKLYEFTIVVRLTL